MAYKLEAKCENGHRIVATKIDKHRRNNIRHTTFCTDSTCKKGNPRNRVYAIQENGK